MDAQLARDNAAFMRQIALSRPENKFEYMQTVDITKHVKNLSVRYLSTKMPTERNLDDWIVLPLFQQGQDIPIENDGRTAILVAHAPSLEQLLKTWYKRIESEQRANDKRRQQKIGKSQTRQEQSPRREKRKRKGSCSSSKDGMKSSKIDLKNEVHHSATKSQSSVDNGSNSDHTTSTSFDLSTVKLDVPSSEFGCEQSSSYDMTMGSVGAFECDLPEMDDCDPPILYDMDSPTDNRERILDLGIHNDDCAVPGGEDWTHPARPHVTVEQEPDGHIEGTASKADPQLNGSSILEDSHVIDQLCMPEMHNSSLSRDDLEDVIEMERQIATIQERVEEQDVKSVCDMNSDIHLECDHAASNLEREMNGEAMECKKFTETLLRVEPSCVIMEPVQETKTEQPSTSAKVEKKQSASSRIKNNLLQRMAESRDVDVDAINSAASENDYRNTFCYICRVDFSSSKGLYLHNVKTHSEGEVQCDVCFKPLKNRITLMKHKKLHLGAEDMQCLCTDCGRPFKDKRALTAHVTYTKHMLDVPFART